MHYCARSARTRGHRRIGQQGWCMALHRCACCCQPLIVLLARLCQRLSPALYKCMTLYSRATLAHAHATIPPHAHNIMRELFACMAPIATPPALRFLLFCVDLCRPSRDRRHDIVRQARRGLSSSPALHHHHCKLSESASPSSFRRGVSLQLSHEKPCTSTRPPDSTNKVVRAIANRCYMTHCT